MMRGIEPKIHTTMSILTLSPLISSFQCKCIQKHYLKKNLTKNYISVFNYIQLGLLIILSGEENSSLLLL